MVSYKKTRTLGKQDGGIRVRKFALLDQTIRNALAEKVTVE